MNSNGALRHILITGTSTGIGRACALHLAKKGFHVWASVHSAADIKLFNHADEYTPGKIRPLHLDVTDAASINAAEMEIKAYCGEEGLCGLVNNAGVCVVGPAEFIALDAWREQFDVNLFGLLAVTQKMLPLLRIHSDRHGKFNARIVNMGSVTGDVSTPLFSAYSASKFAVRALNDALRMELRALGIGVCLIVPGTIQSEIWRKERECVEAIAPVSPARQVYGTLIDNVAGYVFSCADKAIPAERVAAAVHRCLTKARPPIQCRVGWEAQVGGRARKFIPDRLFDYLLGRTMRVP